MMYFLKKILSNILVTITSFIAIISLLLIVISYSSKKIHNQNDKKLSKNSILKIDLSQSIVERNSNDALNLINNESKNTLEIRQVIEAIEKAKNDERIRLIYLNFSEISCGISTIEEIRNKLIDFKECGKKIVAYSNYYSQLSYLISSVSNKVFINSNGFIDLRGVSVSVVFFQDLLSRLGIDIQVVKKGSYKSAVEPYIQNNMSESSRVQTQLLVNDFSNFIINKISEQRNISTNDIENHINNLKLNSASACKKLNYIDEILYEDQLIDTLKSLTESKDLSIINLYDYVKIKTKKNKKISRNKIAVIYANGTISNNEGSVDQIGTKSIIKSLRKARNDDYVKAIVLRVNSPGGSALTSDLIWRETLLTKEKKPLIVSMGDYAASGGYYISCAADSVFSNETSITGSIGVFGIIPNLENLYNEKLGVNFNSVNSHNYSDMGINRPLSEFEKNKIKENIDEIYEKFVVNVSSGRKLDVKYVDKIGQGRVWSGIQAKKIGLVDSNGGLSDAIEAAKKLSNIDDFRVIEFPKKTDPLQDLFSKISSGSKFLSVLNKYDFNKMKNFSLKNFDTYQAHMQNLIFIN